MDLIQAIGKLAFEEGKEWRLDHPELMDAYNACQEERLKEWLKNEHT
jgi:hypothetical protein